MATRTSVEDACQDCDYYCQLAFHNFAEMLFVMLANDPLDRFGVSLEHRFTKEIITMLKNPNLDVTTLIISDKEPYWTFTVKKKKLVSTAFVNLMRLSDTS